MSKIDQLDNAIDHSVTKRDQRIHHPDRQTIKELLYKKLKFGAQRVSPNIIVVVGFKASLLPKI